MEYKPENLMAQASSPYLRQHKDNPVHWQPWGQAAFDAARAQHKPVLLSVGYAACHWCHVMAHESFDNPAIARLINSRFIAIKLDREERPDLDALYQHALALMGQQGGWPLTMFLTPDGVPFWGGTYFPPLPRHHLPGFADVLAGVAESFDHEQDAVAFNANSVKAAIDARFVTPAAPVLTPEIITRAASHMLGECDAVHGGLGSAPKFPQLTKLRLLFDHGLRSGDVRYGDAVVHALVQMCRGGLYDHLGGGFHRYCVDGAWLVPHFEKMLDDQAQFIALLSDVASHHPHPLLIQALFDTVDFVLRDMTDAHTQLCVSSFDADSAGSEGAYYQWTQAEIETLLGSHSAQFCAAYGVAAAGNWDDPHQGGGNILNRLAGSVPQSDEDERILRAMRKKLLYARRERVAPTIDDKILTDANARLIAAIAHAGLRHAQPAWIDAAAARFDTLTHLAINSDGLARHDACNTNSVCLLDDSAALALAALALADARPDMQTHYHAWARKLAHRMTASFCTDNSVSMLPVAAQDSFAQVPPCYDTPAPAAAALLLRVCVAVSHVTQDDALMRSADMLAATLGGHAREHFTMMASALSALQFYQNPVIIHASTAWDAVLTRYIPDCLRLYADDAPLLACTGTRCQMPAHDENAAKAAISSALRAGLHKPANA